MKWGLQPGCRPVHCQMLLIAQHRGTDLQSALSPEMLYEFPPALYSEVPGALEKEQAYKEDKVFLNETCSLVRKNKPDKLFKL